MGKKLVKYANSSFFISYFFSEVIYIYKSTRRRLLHYLNFFV